VPADTPEVFQGPRGVYFPVHLHEAEYGRRGGIPWLAATLLVGTDDVGYIPWYQMRCLN
jgi:hypothetical protein